MDTRHGQLPEQLLLSSVRDLSEEQLVLCYSDQPLREVICPKVGNSFFGSIYDPTKKFQPSTPVVWGYAPCIADVAILRALRTEDPEQKVGSYVIPKKDGHELFLLARNPLQLKGRRGWVQVVSKKPFRNVEDDPKTYPLYFMYDGSECLPVIHQFEVGASDLQKKIAYVPEEIALDQVLVQTSSVVEQDGVLVINYQSPAKKAVTLDLYRVE